MTKEKREARAAAKADYELNPDICPVCFDPVPFDRHQHNAEHCCRQHANQATAKKQRGAKRPR
jgi:hypothetical protein